MTQAGRARTVLAGAIGATLVAAGGSLAPPLTSRDAPTVRSAVGHAAFLAGMAVLALAWTRLVRSRPDLRTAAAVAAIWAVPLLLTTPLASRDVHSYAAQGELVARGLDPYEEPPRALADEEFVSRVDPLWRDTPAPYGPGWLAAGGAVVRAADHDQARSVAGFRVLALAGVVLLAAATAALARDRGTAVALTVANPLTLLHLVSGVHNEALMVGLGAAGVALAWQRRRVVAGVVLIGLAAAVKVPALALLPVVGWHVSGRHRLRNAVLASLGGLTTLAAVAAATGLGWGWVGELGTPGGVRTALSPVTGLGVTLGSAVDAIGLGTTKTVLGIVRGAAFLGMAATAAYLLFRGNRLAAGAVMVLLAFLNPAVHVWYALWGLPLLAGDEELREPLVRMSVVLSLVILPNGTSVLSWAKPLRFVLGAAVVWVAVGPLCRTIARRATTGTSSADSGPQRAGDGGSPVARPA